MPHYSAVISVSENASFVNVKAYFFSKVLLVLQDSAVVEG